MLRRGTERLAIAYVVAQTQDSTAYAALGQLVKAERDWSGHAILDAAVFTVGALVLNAALYRAHLVPKWLSVWGLAGAAAHLAAGVLVLYGLEPLSTPQVLLEAPLGLQELALALWLILKGFSLTSSSDDAVGEGRRHPVTHAASGRQRARPRLSTPARSPSASALCRGERRGHCR